MTAAERFQEIFPGFNKVIISQFETEVSAYIDYVDGVKNSWQEFFEKSLPHEIMNRPKRQNDGLFPFMTGFSPVAELMILNPPLSNAIKVNANAVVNVISRAEKYEWPNDYDESEVSRRAVVNIYSYNATIRITYDQRLFNSISVTADLNSFSNRFNFINESRRQYFFESYHLQYNAPYSLDALIYLRENGVSADFIDYEKLSQFLVYLHAYEKNANQIKANLLATQSEMTNQITDFTQRLAAMAHQQNTYLQGVRMQIEANIKSDAQQQLAQLASAKNSLNVYALQLKGICGH